MNIKQDILDKKSLDILILGQALLMSSTNRIFEAKKFYEQLINNSSDALICTQAYLGKADALYNLAEYAQAVEVYKEGLDKITEQNSVPNELTDKLRYNLGLAYVKAGQIDSSLNIFGSIVEKSDNQDIKASALFQIGEACQEASNFKKAQEAYAKILKLYPDSAYIDYALYQLGVSQSKNLEYAQAIDSFNLLLKKYSQSKLLGDAVYSLGIIYFQKADYQKSCEIFSRFQDEFKDSPLRLQALYMLGTSFIGLGKINEALVVYKEIFKNYSQDVELAQKAEYEIADCYYKLGQENEALKQFKFLRTKYPGSSITPDVIWWLGQYYYRANNPEIASRYFSSLIKDFPSSDLRANAFYALGLTSSEENKSEEAIENFKMALNGGRDLKAQATVSLAKIYYKLGDYQEAKFCYNRALELADAKDLADIHFNFAESFEANLELKDAVKEYLFAADLYTDSSLSSRALLRVAKLYEDMDNFKDARTLYKRILAQGGQEAKIAQERIEWIDSVPSRK
jgi:TolA-binding protein